jgi:hypothetical protein
MNWYTKCPTLTGFGGYLAAWDSVRERVIFVLGYHVYEWYDGQIHAVTTSTVPRGNTSSGFAAITFDSVRGKVVAFGGLTPPFVVHNDTWEYDGSDWSQVVTTHAPLTRWNTGLAFDPVRGKTVLFAGYADPVPGGAVNDTWEYDGSDWTQIFPAHSPSARADGVPMDWDPVNNYVFLHGGGGPSTGDDTWTYDGTDWTELFPATQPSPSGRKRSALGGIPGVGIVMFGLQDGSSAYIEDTWKWDGSNWVDLAPTNHPSLSSGHFGIPNILPATLGNQPLFWMGHASDGHFWTWTPPPTINSHDSLVTSSTETDLTVNITPSGEIGSTVEVWLDYGTTTGYGISILVDTATISTLPASATDFTETITGLTPGTTYHYRWRIIETGGCSASDSDDTWIQIVTNSVCDDFINGFSPCVVWGTGGTGTIIFTSDTMKASATITNNKFANIGSPDELDAVMNEWFECRFLFSIDNASGYGSSTEFGIAELSNFDPAHTPGFGHTILALWAIGYPDGSIKFFAYSNIYQGSGQDTSTNFLTIAANQVYDVSMFAKVTSTTVYYRIEVDGVEYWNSSKSSSSTYFNPYGVNSIALGKLAGSGTGPTPILSYGGFRYSAEPVSEFPCPPCGSGNSLSGVRFRAYQ